MRTLTALAKNVESLFTRIGELDNGMQTNLTTLQQTFAKQFGDLNVSAGQNTEELKSYLEELNNGLKQDMNQVFTSVSNGKKKLASALLTKRSFHKRGRNICPAGGSNFKH